MPRYHVPDLAFESRCDAPVCGIDEVGRGPWAGPVVACAVILDPANVPVGLKDSKLVSKARREVLAAEVLATADVGLGEASVAEIDRLNILQATYLAMRRAVAGLSSSPHFALIDGNRIPPDFPCPAQAIVKGDNLSASIAAASIVAKVARDRMMVALAQQYPGYGWETNAGYGVKLHQQALQSLGITPHHRRSFKPIHKILCEEI
nr:ribonuclease HII [Algicella marina]